MAVTNKLGTADSYGGSLTLGIVPTSGGGGGDTYDRSLGIAAEVSLTVLDNTPNQDPSVEASIDISPTIDYQVSLSLAASAAVTALPGLSIEVFITADAVAAITLLPGFGYDEPVDIDAVADATTEELTIYGEVLAIDAEASITVEETYELGGLLTISAVSDLSITIESDYVADLLISGTAQFYPEDLFDFLISEAFATASLTTDYTYEAGAPLSLQPNASVSAEVEGTYHKSASNTLNLTQSVYVTRPIINTIQSFPLTQSVTKQKISNLNVVQTFTMTHEAVRVHPVDQTFNISQSVSHIRVHNLSVTQTFPFSQTGFSASTLNFSVSQTFSMTQQALFGLVTGDCQFQLTTPLTAILLPCPLFGDQETNLHQVLIKRMTNGSRYSYVRRSNTRKLMYTFTIDTQKRHELYTFLKNNHSQRIRLDNHKGERWDVQLVNNPFSFDSRGRFSQRREKWDVVLEFEGVRIS